MNTILWIVIIAVVAIISFFLGVIVNRRAVKGTVDLIVKRMEAMEEEENRL